MLVTMMNILLYYYNEYKKLYMPTFYYHNKIINILIIQIYTEGLF